MRAVLEWGEQKCASENPRRVVLDAAGKNDTRTTEKWSEKKMRNTNTNNANDGGDGASGGVGEKRR